MPNHVTHRIVVTAGDSDQLTEFQELCFTEGEFDFEKILPMPEALKGISSGFTNIDGEQVSLWREVDGESVAISVVEQAELVRDYGTASWYDWCVENWGTKWNAYETDIVYDGTTSIEFTFNTAWSMPIPIFEELSRRFTDLRFSVQAFDEGWNFAAVGHFDHDGVFIDEEQANDEIYEEVYGYAPEKYDEDEE